MSHNERDGSRGAVPCSAAAQLAANSSNGRAHHRSEGSASTEPSHTLSSSSSLPANPSAAVATHVELTHPTEASAYTRCADAGHTPCPVGARPTSPTGCSVRPPALPEGPPFKTPHHAPHASFMHRHLLLLMLAITERAEAGEDTPPPGSVRGLPVAHVGSAGPLTRVPCIYSDGSGTALYAIMFTTDQPRAGEHRDHHGNQDRGTEGPLTEVWDGMAYQRLVTHHLTFTGGELTVYTVDGTSSMATAPTPALASAFAHTVAELAGGVLAEACLAHCRGLRKASEAAAAWGAERETLATADLVAPQDPWTWCRALSHLLWALLPRGAAPPFLTTPHAGGVLLHLLWPLAGGPLREATTHPGLVGALHSRHTIRDLLSLCVCLMARARAPLSDREGGEGTTSDAVREDGVGRASRGGEHTAEHTADPQRVGLVHRVYELLGEVYVAARAAGPHPAPRAGDGAAQLSRQLSFLTGLRLGQLSIRYVCHAADDAAEAVDEYMADVFANALPGVSAAATGFVVLTALRGELAGAEAFLSPRLHNALLLRAAAMDLQLRVRACHEGLLLGPSAVNLKDLWAVCGEYAPRLRPTSPQTRVCEGREAAQVRAVPQHELFDMFLAYHVVVHNESPHPHSGEDGDDGHVRPGDSAVRLLEAMPLRERAGVLREVAQVFASLYDAQPWATLFVQWLLSYTGSPVVVMESLLGYLVGCHASVKALGPAPTSAAVDALLDAVEEARPSYDALVTVYQSEAASASHQHPTLVRWAADLVRATEGDSNGGDGVRDLPAGAATRLWSAWRGFQPTRGAGLVARVRRVLMSTASPLPDVEGECAALGELLPRALELEGAPADEVASGLAQLGMDYATAEGSPFAPSESDNDREGGGSRQEVGPWSVWKVCLGLSWHRRLWALPLPAPENPVLWEQQSLVNVLVCRALNEAGTDMAPHVLDVASSTYQDQYGLCGYGVLQEAQALLRGLLHAFDGRGGGLGARLCASAHHVSYLTLAENTVKAVDRLLHEVVEPGKIKPRELTVLLAHVPHVCGCVSAALDDEQNCVVREGLIDQIYPGDGCAALAFLSTVLQYGSSRKEEASALTRSLINCVSVHERCCVEQEARLRRECDQWKRLASLSCFHGESRRDMTRLLVDPLETALYRELPDAFARDVAALVGDHFDGETDKLFNTYQLLAASGLASAMAARLDAETRPAGGLVDRSALKAHLHALGKRTVELVSHEVRAKLSDFSAATIEWIRGTLRPSVLLSERTAPDPPCTPAERVTGNSASPPHAASSPAQGRTVVSRELAALNEIVSSRDAAAGGPSDQAISDDMAVLVETVLWADILRGDLDTIVHGGAWHGGNCELQTSAQGPAAALYAAVYGPHAGSADSLRHAAHRFEAAMGSLAAFPVGCVVSLESLAELCARQTMYAAVMVQRATMTSGEAALVDGWVRLLGVSQTIREASLMQEVIEAHRGDWPALQHLTRNREQARAILRESRQLSQAVRVACALHDAHVSLVVHDVDDDPCGLEMRATTEDGTLLTQDDIVDVERQLVSHGHLACSAEDAKTIAKGPRSQDWDRLVEAFLFSCEQWRALRRLSAMLMDTAAMTAEGLRERITTPHTLYFAQSVEAVVRLQETLQSCLDDWLQHMERVRRLHPELWLLTHAQTRKARELILAGAGASDEGPVCELVICAWAMWISPLIPPRVRGEPGQFTLKGFLRKVLPATLQSETGVGWLDPLAEVMSSLARESLFHPVQVPSLPPAVVAPLTFHALAREKGVTSCMVVEQQACACTSRSDMLLWCLSAYKANFARSPHAFEVLVCTPSTSGDDVDCFLRQWSALSHRPWTARGRAPLCFTLVNVELLRSEVFDTLRRTYHSLPVRTVLDEGLAWQGAVDGERRGEEVRAPVAEAVRPTLVILVGAVAPGREPWGASVSEALSPFGTVVLLDRASLASAEPILATVREEKRVPGGHPRIDLMGGHSASRFCCGGDAAAWAFVGPQYSASAKAPPCALYVRCPVTTEARTCTELVDAQRRCPAGTPMSTRLDVNPFMDPAETNRVLFSLILWGQLRSGAETYVATVEDRFILVVPPPACVSSESGAVSVNATTKAGEVEVGRYSATADCIANALLPRTAGPREVVTQRLVLRVAPSPAVLRRDPPPRARKAPLTSPPSCAGGEATVATVTYAEDGLGRGAMQAVLFALGFMAGVVPHFPLPHVLDSYTVDSSLPLHHFLVIFSSSAAMRSTAVAYPVSPSDIFALAYGLLTRPELLASCGAVNEQELRARTAPAVLAQPPEDLGEDTVACVFRFCAQLPHVVYEVLGHGDYRDLRTVTPGPPPAARRDSDLSRVLHISADPHLLALPLPSERARVLGVLRRTADAILDAVRCCAAQNRVSLPSAPPPPPWDGPHRSPTNAGADLYRWTLGGGSERLRAALGPRPCPASSSTLSGTAAARVMSAQFPLRAPSPIELEMVDSTVCTMDGAVLGEGLPTRLAEDPMELLPSTAVSAGFGTKLREASAALHAAIAEGDDSFAVEQLPRYEDVLAIRAMRTRARPPLRAAVGDQTRTSTLGDPQPSQTVSRLQCLAELKADVDAFCDHVTAGTVAEWVKSLWTTGSVTERATRRRSPRPFTLTPYLVRRMMEVTRRWRAAEPVLLTGDPGTGKSSFAAYCAAMSGLPFRTLPCDGTMGGVELVERIAQLVEEVDEARALSEAVLCHPASPALSVGGGAARCVVVLDHLDRVRAPWVVKQVLLDDRFPGVRFLATVSAPQTSGVVQVDAMTVPLARELRPMLCALTQPSQRVVRSARFDGTATGLVTDEQHMTRAAARYLLHQCRWVVGAAGVEHTLGSLLGADGEEDRIEAALVDAMDEVLRTSRGEAACTRAEVVGRDDGPPPTLTPTPSLRLLWAWVEAFLFLVTVSAQDRSPARVWGSPESSVSGHGGRESDRLLTYVYGATLLSGGLARPAEARAAWTASALKALRTEPDAPTPLYHLELREIVRRCTHTPAGVHAGPQMSEMVMDLQLIAFSDARMAVFLHGPPGVGKTLATRCVEWASGGAHGGPALLSCLPYTRCVRRRVLCSADTRPEDIENVARDVARAELAGEAVAILELDEVGRVAGSKTEAQSALCRIIDDGIYLPETGLYHRVRVVCLSSTYLDRPTMSRFFVVDSPRWSRADFTRAAQALSTALPPAMQGLVRWHSFFQAAPAWVDRVNNTHRTLRSADPAGPAATDLITCRDVYAVVRTTLYLLLAGSRQGTAVLAAKEVAHAVFLAFALNIGVCGSNEAWVRDFWRLAHAAAGTVYKGGREDGVEPVLCGMLTACVDHVHAGERVAPLCSVCAAAQLLGGTGGGEAAVRHVVPESRDEGKTSDSNHCASSSTITRDTLTLLLGLATRSPMLHVEGRLSVFTPRLRHPMLVGPPMHAWHVARALSLFGPQQSGPAHVIVRGLAAYAMEDVSRDMAQAKVAVRDGGLLVLVGASHVYDYLNDVLNQDYDDVGGEAYTSLNNKGSTERIRVHDAFRVFALVSEEELTKLAGTVQSRFCKLRVSHELLLSPALLLRAQAWYHRFDLPASTEESAGKGQPGRAAGTVNMFSYLVPGLHLETVYALAACLRSRGDGADTLNGSNETAQWERLLHFAVSPTRYLHLGVLTNTRLREGTVGDLLQTFHGVYEARDDLPSAFSAYARVAREQGLTLPVHALVFTGQQPCDGRVGAIQRGLLATAWATTVAAMANTRTEREKTVSEMLPAVVLDMTAMSFACVHDALAGVRQKLRTSPDNVTLPIVCCLLDGTTAALEQRHGAAGDRETVAWQLQCITIALENGGLLQDPRLHVAVVVMPSPTTLFTAPPLANASPPSYSSTLDEGLRWAHPGMDWAVLHVDEVLPMAASSAYGQGSPPGDEAPVVATTPEPPFTLADILGPPACSPVLLLGKSAPLLVSLLRANAVALAQELALHSGSLESTTAWLGGLRALFGSTEQTAMRETSPLGQVLVSYMGRACEALMAQHKHAQEVRQSKEGLSRGQIALVALCVFDRDSLLGLEDRAVVSAPRAHGGCPVDRRAVREPTLRSRIHRVTARVALNLAAHVLGLLFDSPLALRESCRVAATPEAVPCAFAQYVLTQCGPGGSLLPLDMLTATSTRRVLSVAQVRERQPFLCRKAPPGGAKLVAARLPLSYPIYRLLMEGGELTGTAHAADRVEGQAATALREVLRRVRTSDDVDLLVRDCLVYFLETCTTLTEESAADAVLWCLVALVDLRTRERADSVRPASEGEMTDHWSDGLSATTFLCAFITSESKWLVSAHAYCTQVVSANGAYVDYVRACCPCAILVRGQGLFRSTTDFYKCLTVNTPIRRGRIAHEENTHAGTQQAAVEGGGSDSGAAPPSYSSPPSAAPPLPRLRVSPQELVRMRQLTAEGTEACFWGDAQRLSYALYHHPLDEAPIAVGMGEDYTSAMLKAQQLTVTQSFLRHGAKSENDMCLWLGQTIRWAAHQPSVVADWVRNVVVPLVVLHLRLSGGSEGPTGGRQRLDDVLPAKDEVADDLVRAMFSAPTGQLPCPWPTAVSILRGSLRRWCGRWAAASTAANAGVVPQAEGFPMAYMADAVRQDLAGDAALAVVTAVVHELRAQRMAEHGHSRERGPGMDAAEVAAGDGWPPPIAEGAAGMGDSRGGADAETRAHLWHLVQFAWSAWNDNRSFALYGLATCMAVGLLQVEMEVVHDAPSLPARAQTGAAHAAWGATEADSAGRAALAALAAKLHRFQHEWAQIQESAGVKPEAADPAQLRYPIYILLVRVLSSNGLDLPHARERVSALMDAAAPASRPNFHDSVVLTDLTMRKGPDSVLRALLSDEFVLTPGEQLPAPVKVHLMHAVECLSANTKPEESFAGTEMGRFCSGFRQWRATVSDGWSDVETQRCLAAMGLYLIAGTSTGSRSPISNGNSSSYVLRVVRGGTQVSVSLSDMAAIHAESRARWRKALVMAQASHALAAFAGCLLRMEQTSFTSDAERQLADELIIALQPSCPKCHAVFDNFTGCCALECQCRNFFCAWCLGVSGTSTSVHAHVLKCRLSRNKNNHFTQIHLWFAVYVKHVFTARLEAMCVRRKLECNVNGRMQAFRTLTAAERNQLRSMSPAVVQWMRYRAMGAVVRMGFALGVHAALIADALAAAADEAPARLPDVQLTNYDTCLAHLEDCVDRAEAVFFPNSRVTRRVVLKCMFAYLARARVNRMTSPVTPELLYDTTDDPHTIVTALAAHCESDASDMLASVAGWKGVFQQTVQAALERHEPGARLPFLFRTTPVDAVDVDERTAAVVRTLHRSGPRELATLLERLHVLERSFSPQAAASLGRVLDFAWDACRTVRREFVSLGQLRRERLSYLITHHGSLFPRTRVRAFIRAARDTLAVLGRADNQCHGQHFTMADTDSAEGIDLAEAVLLDEGRLLHVLFTGTNAVGDAAPTCVGYGNAQDGQTRVLEGVGGAWGQCSPARPGTTAALLLEASTELIQYDPRLPPLLACLVDPQAFPPSAIPSQESTTEAAAAVAAETIRRAMGSSAGFFARPALPRQLPSMELDSEGVLAVLLGAMESLVAPFEALAARSQAGLQGSASPPGEGGVVSGWYARVAVVVVEDLCQPHGGGVTLDKSGLGNEGGGDPRPTQRDLFAFLMAYARYAVAVVSTYLYEDPMAGSAADATLTGVAAAPPPSFDQVPSQLLTEGQRGAQVALATLGVDPRELPMLLLAAFDESTFPDAGTAGRTAVGPPATADNGEGEGLEGGSVEATVGALKDLGPAYGPALVAILKLLALTADIVGFTGQLPLTDVIHRVLDAESDSAAAFIAARVGPNLTLASLVTIIGLMRRSL